MLSKLHILTNTTCNLSCTYCYVDQSPKKITYPIFRKSLATFTKFYKNSSQKELSLSLAFVGGEPLLCWDVLKKSILFARKTIDHLKIDVLTNGTLLDHDKFSFLNKLGVHITLSLDGPAPIHNYYRKSTRYPRGTLDTIIRNIEQIPFESRSSILISSVVSPPFLNNLFDRFAYFRKLGFKSFRFVPNFNWRDWQSKDIKEFESAMKRFANDYCSIFTSSHSKRQLFIIDNLLEVFKAKVVGKNNIRYIENKFEDCGSLCVSTDGDFVICDKILGMVSKNSDMLSIRDINGDIDMAKRHSLLKEAGSYFIKALKRNKIANRNFIFCPFLFYFNEKLLNSSQREFNKAIFFYFKITEIYNDTIESIFSNLIENNLFRKEYKI